MTVIELNARERFAFYYSHDSYVLFSTGSLDAIRVHLPRRYKHAALCGMLSLGAIGLGLWFFLMAGPQFFWIAALALIFGFGCGLGGILLGLAKTTITFLDSFLVSIECRVGPHLFSRKAFASSQWELILGDIRLSQFGLQQWQRYGLSAYFRPTGYLYVLAMASNATELRQNMIASPSRVKSLIERAVEMNTLISFP